MYNVFQYITTVSLVGACILGDEAQKTESMVYGHWRKALADNLTHAVVSGLSWLLVLDIAGFTSRYGMLELLLSIVLGSVIDLDHFITARSVKIMDAVSLPSRPFLHCTTLMILLFQLLLLTSVYFQSTLVYRLSWILLISSISHHTRDAQRRGYWLYPFGSTRSIPYWLYIFIIAALPQFVRLFVNETGRKQFASLHLNQDENDRVNTV